MPVLDRAHLAGLLLPDAVRSIALNDPQRIAVIDTSSETKHTYAELWDDAMRFTSLLRARGVAPGDGVSVQLPNRYQTIVVFLGVLAAGARLNPLLPNYRFNELAHVLTVSRAKVFVAPSFYRGFDHAALAKELADAVPQDLQTEILALDAGDAGRTLGDLLAGSTPYAGPTLARQDEVCEVIFTSGTESKPKGVMHSERTTNYSASALAEHLALSEDDIVWMPSPIGHSTGLNFGVRAALLTGMALILQDRWNAEQAVRIVNEYRPTYTLAATTFLLDLITASEGSDLSSLRYFCCGGATVPSEVVRQGQDHGIGVLRLYGLTEALVVACNTPGSGEEQLLSTDGAPLPGTTVTALDDDGAPLPAGETGEIGVRGPNVCLGYFNDPERTEHAFTADGWLRSGDVGHVDDDGYLTITGRKKELIIRGGLNIAPREIEDLIAEMEHVVEVAVVGIPDERLGEKVCTCLVVDTGVTITLEDVVAYLRASDLATYKLPQALVIVETLPKTLTGKVQKVVLRNQVMEEAS